MLLKLHLFRGFPFRFPVCHWSRYDSCSAVPAWVDLSGEHHAKLSSSVWLRYSAWTRPPRVSDSRPRCSGDSITSQLAAACFHGSERAIKGRKPHFQYLRNQMQVFFRPGPQRARGDDPEHTGRETSLQDGSFGLFAVCLWQQRPEFLHSWGTISTVVFIQDS